MISTILFALLIAVSILYLAQYNKMQENESELRKLRAREKIVKREYAELAAKKAEAAAIQNAAAAIERQIKGYGDRYIIPHIQLIDEYAEKYSLENVGSRLKESRAEMRAMLKEGSAAENPDASKVLLDYFVAKSDALIEKVKQENYGKLKQELEDIYALTEYYALRIDGVSMVSTKFYRVRQDELKWAGVIQAMRIAEREQQREIRERMREDERARKEYERAIRETERDEAILKEAMEKARKSYESASAAQKAKYEEQLKTLESRLREAEDKNRRALSMAQQTRAGNVYIISNIGSFGNDMFKIGMTRRLDPMDRVNELGDASVPFRFDVHAMIYSEDAPKLEKELHRIFNRFRVNKVNYRKEFFRVSMQQIRAELERLGIKTTFTLVAEASEYRETQRIESMGGAERDKLLDKLLKQE